MNLETTCPKRLFCLWTEKCQKCLLSEVNLTFKRAVDIAQVIEVVEQHMQQLKNKAAVQQVSPGSTCTKACGHCGKNKHQLSQCQFKEAICNNCYKKGHLAKIYRAPRQKTGCFSSHKGTKEPSELKLTNLEKTIMTQIQSYHCLV